jgi:hypothetical protein
MTEPLPSAPQNVEILEDEEEFDVPSLCVPFS